MCVRLSTMLYEFQAGNKTLVFDGDSLRFYVKPEEGGPLWIPTLSKAEPSTVMRPEPTLRHIALILTNKCNMTCTYCYANHGAYDKPDITMDFETAVRAVELVYESTKKAIEYENIITIAFFGGEPSLEFGLIRRVVDHVERTLPKPLSVRYLLSTNGTGIGVDEVHFLRDHRFLVTLSIDGDESMHNAARTYRDGTGSYTDVVSAFERLRMDVPVRARITASSANPQIHDSIVHVRKLGFETITFAPDLDMDDDAFRTFLDSIGDLSTYYADQIRIGNYLNITNIADIMATVALRRKKLSHCNAGLSYLSVSADGRLYRCPRFTGDEDFCLGEVSTVTIESIEGSLRSLRAALKDHVAERVRECVGCPFLYLCGGMCYHEANKRTGHDLGFDKRECDYRKSIITNTLRLLCEVPEERRVGLFRYLDQLWRRETGLSTVKEYELGLTPRDLNAIADSSSLAACEGGSEGDSG